MTESGAAGMTESGAAGMTESGAAGGHGPDALRWVVDPLDGTTNYLYGHPQWAVSVAAESPEGLLAAAVYAPVADEMFLASADGPATCNGVPLSVSSPAGLGVSLIATGFAYGAGDRAWQGAVVAGLLPRVRDIRRDGSAALDLAWVAAGRLDGYYEALTEPWDVAAGSLLVARAGGVVTALDSPRGAATGVVAAGPALHPALRAALTRLAPGADPPLATGGPPRM